MPCNSPRGWCTRVRWTFAALGALLTAACADTSPVSTPIEPLPQSLAIAAAPAAMDCAVLRVERHGKGITATISAQPGCAGVQIAHLESAELRVEAGRPMDPMRLSISLENTAAEFDYGDVGLVLDLAAATTSRGGNVAPNGSALVVAANQDALTPADHPTPSAPIWLYGPQADAADAVPTRLLESGERSTARALELHVHPSVKSFSIPIRVHAGTMLFQGLAATMPMGSRVLAAVAHKEGSQLAVFGGSQPEGAVFVAPNGQTITVWTGADGKPARAVFPGHVVLFADWTATSVDMAVVKADSSTQVFEDVPISSEPVALTAQAASDGPQLFIAVDPFMLQALVKSASVALSATSCAVAALAIVPTGGLAIPLAGLACGSFLLESVSILAPSVGEHPIMQTSISALQITDCVVSLLLDPDCWMFMIGGALDYLAENEGLLARLSVPIEEADLLLRGGVAGSAIELGTLGGTESAALDINRSGQVVGWSHLPNGETRAFLWTAGSGMRSLGTLGGANSVAYAINDRGEVVGTSQTATRMWRAFLWTPTGGMRDLGALSGLNSEALDINENGVVVGTDNTTGDRRAFRWTAGAGMSYLPVPVVGGTSAAYGVNNAGEVVGWTARCFSCSGAAAHWDAAGSHTQIHPPFFGYIDSRALDINDAGQVVGYAYGSRARPFIWPAPDGDQPACALSGGDGRAQGISNTGEIVGVGSTSFSTSPVYSRPVRCRMPQFAVGQELARPSGEEGSVEKVNDSGFAVGSIRNPQGQTRAVRWHLP